MRSIIDILYKNFQEDLTNSRSFPGFPGVVDTLHLQAATKNQQRYCGMTWHAEHSRYEQQQLEKLDHRQLTAVYDGQAMMMSTLTVGGI